MCFDYTALRNKNYVGDKERRWVLPTYISIIVYIKTYVKPARNNIDVA